MNVSPARADALTSTSSVSAASQLFREHPCCQACKGNNSKKKKSMCQVCLRIQTKIVCGRHGYFSVNGSSPLQQLANYRTHDHSTKVQYRLTRTSIHSEIG